MFYDRFLVLCNSKGVKPTNACIEAGLSRGLAAKWKSTKTEKPSAEALEKMSAYFGLSIDEILGNTSKKEKPPSESGEGRAIDVVDDELREYLDELRSRPEKKLLFSVTKNATKEQIEAIVKMVEAMQGDGGTQ